MNYVIYYRVSTKEQEYERQEHIVKGFLKPTDVTLGIYAEKVSGSKGRKRPELQKALAHARQSGATLVVAELTRLSRKVVEGIQLLEGNVPILDASSPNDPPVMQHLKLVLGQEEARTISERVRKGMEARRTAGSKQGAASQKWQEKNAENTTAIRAGLKEAVEAAAEKKRQAKEQRKQDLAPVLVELEKHGHTTFRQKAAALNARGFRTSTGKPYTATAVHRLEN